MNKRKVVLASLLGFTLLFGCSQVEEEKELHVSSNKVSAEEVISDNFEIISESEEGAFTYELIHTPTQCHYVQTHKGGLTQMFIEKDGVSVPYCDK